MVNIDVQAIEDAILEEIEKLKDLPTIDPEAKIDKDSKPGMIGLSSNVLVTVSGFLEEILQVEIPPTCYIFRDSDGIRELNIREAAEKLQKIAKPCKTT
ncbi:hypothetical protein INP83_12860 [Mucilaginibacter sp. 21P]|uniref:hypothetical protein n=1 Tax=Mucilaginibacter sp. 21P TaxID=2778902 RepID=UPI001C56CCA2|nr:hypothetical protein [Mucilaginibacter sp. 21P]QXV63988.1 hypothetical protein INP83_12860 [Mucilaginibacter sp. 21P]